MKRRRLSWNLLSVNGSKKQRIFGGFFEIDQKKQAVQNLEKQIADPVYWKDHSKLALLNKEKSHLVQIIEEWENLYKKLKESQNLLQIIYEEKDEECFRDLKKESQQLSQSVYSLEIKSFLCGGRDPNNAYMTIHSGAGGTEAQDWSFMLYRMYLKWIEKKKFQAETISLLEGEEAGVKSVTLKVSGLYAYGYLKGESGVHRLVRISPFDANSRRHTSFSSVFVWPEAGEDIQMSIKNEDLRVDTYRASGAGGQHVNKTDSAVRITHLPTGQVVQCQNQRSQHANRQQAMKLLHSILHQLELDKKQEEKRVMQAGKKANEWGSQIRSYVLHPYKMVKDHRTHLGAGSTGKCTQRRAG